MYSSQPHEGPPRLHSHLLTIPRAPTATGLRPAVGYRPSDFTAYCTSMQAVWRQSPLLVCGRDREGATTRHTSFPGARFANQVRPQGGQSLADPTLTMQSLAGRVFLNAVRVTHMHRLRGFRFPNRLGNYLSGLLPRRGVPLRFGEQLLAAVPETPRPRCGWAGVLFLWVQAAGHGSRSPQV